ncbi:hypothetical protein ABVK25_003842 [Lepraria finkii]|uniref:NADH dehydrogenase subunit 2 n=1 Tax=Lepraria finkii TaxID=1340010 RepID=A0ABR4BCY4_9LECA
MPALGGTVTLAKFVGTISLGLLTGGSYTISTTTLPPILALPTAQPAHTTFLHLRTLTQRHQILLSTLSTSSLIIAYILSPTAPSASFPSSGHHYASA